MRGRWSALAPAVLLFLGACGGGGGDAPPGGGGSNPQAPLTLNAQTSPLAMTLAVGFSETALMIGHFAHDALATWIHSPESGVMACASGQRTTTFHDLDGSGGVTPGDVLSWQYNACWLPLLGSTATGTLEIVVEPSARSDGLAGSVRIVGPLSLTAPSDPAQLSLSGGLSFDGHAARMSSSMKVRSMAGTDLAVTVSANGQSLTERLQAFENSKTMDLVTARYEVRLLGQLASTVLNGRVNLRTDSPLVGWMGAVPDGGRASITSQGNSSAWLALTANPSSVAATVQVDSNGNGVADSSFELPWNDVLDGYLFWAQGAVPPKLMGVDVYPEAKPQRPDFTLLANLTATGPLPLKPTFVWQMSLPIDQAALPAMVLRRQSPDTSPWIRVPDADWGPADVPVEVVAAEGSRLTLAPTVQLQPGRTYAFFQVVNGQAAEPNLVLRDVLGRTVTVYQDGQTRSGLKAAITMPPGPPTGLMGALGLDGSKSTDDMAAITQYAWRQASGPAVRIESPDAATTLLSMVGAWPTTETTVEIELTITNAAGEIDVARFAMPVLPVPTTPPALYFRSAPDSFVGSGQTKALDGSSRFEARVQGNYMFDVYVNEPSGTLWSLRFSTLYGDNRLTPGRYQGTGDVFANNLNFFGGGSGTSWESWTLDLRAIEWDTSGRVTVLDADFYLHSSDSRLYGSVRIGSGTPIRP